MKKLIFSLIFTSLLVTPQMTAQEMDNDKLNSIIYTISESVDGQNGNWQFVIDSTMFICLTDKLHNRMRIISPIANANEITDDQIKRCMKANFHSALDVKYAISEDVLWSAFIHPLRELTKEQVLSAISQVYSCAKTFGTTYSSGALSFPTKEDRDANDN